MKWLLTLCFLASQVEASLEISTGVRRDSLQWILGHESQPLSKLTWRELKSVTTTVSGCYALEDCWLIQGYGTLGIIYNGHSKDSDYDASGDEYLRSIHSADIGQLYDFSLALGKRCGSWTPLMGISLHSQRVSMSHGLQIIPTITHIDGLNSSYQAVWFGPWIGVEHRRELTSCLSLKTTLEGHLASYYGIGHWNLRSDIVGPFHHHALGGGLIAKTAITYNLSPCLALSLAGNLQAWRTLQGIDHSRVRVYSDVYDRHTRLSEVRLLSCSLEAKLSYGF